MFATLMQQISSTNPILLAVVLFLGAGTGTLGTSTVLSTGYATELYVDSKVEGLQQMLEMGFARQQKRELETEIFNLQQKALHEKDSFTPLHAKWLNQKEIELEEVKERISNTNQRF